MATVCHEKRQQQDDSNHSLALLVLHELQVPMILQTYKNGFQLTDSGC
uniref:Uncharacterized protein n=1 Tax=Peronospora matthiolae TaxID=2874970 RepID=A0AAV1TAP9_9STRA